MINMIIMMTAMMVQLCDLIGRPQSEAGVYVRISLYMHVRINKFDTKLPKDRLQYRLEVVWFSG